LKPGRILALLGWTLPALAQYAGPAILSRGEAPAAMDTPAISFRPFLEVRGVYDTGLAGVAVSDQGDLANQASEGVMAAWGISGSHSWRHTKIGLDYRGSLSHYAKQTYYDSTDQSLMLGITHQMTRHSSLVLRETAGTFSRDFGLLGLPLTVPYDPSGAYIPTTDFFDNRTVYVSSQAGLIIQKSARLSFDLEGVGFLVGRRSTALYGVKGYGATGDMQYRVSRKTSIGIAYQYQHYDFTRVFGASDVHTLGGTYSVRMSRTVEFSSAAGVQRLETNFVRTVPVDPAITALLGITSGSEVFHGISYGFFANGRLSRAFPMGVAYLSASHSATPGNGLFLTSEMTAVSAGYTYTGIRRWSFNAGAGYDRSKSVANVQGEYSDVSGTLSASRQIARSVHLVVNYSVRRYGSGDFSKYNRVVHEAGFGIGFTPGDVPLRIW